MFKSLREKLSGWFGKEKKEPEKVGEKKVAEKIKKENKNRKAKKKSEKKEIIIESVSPLSSKLKEEKYETPTEELKEEFVPEEKQGFFARLKKKLSSSVLEKSEFDELFYELELVLLENNVALEVVDKIRGRLGKDLVGVSVKKDEVEKTIKDSLKGAISEVLVEGDNLFEKIEKSLESYVILFFGINGTGKTTSIAKLAWALKKKGVSCLMVAADTFRAASIEQLEKHALKIGVPIVKGEYGKDPASVVFDALSFARKNKIKVVLIDTAGRMYTQGNLMKEMEKIVKVSKPNLKVFVGESITGNDVVSQATAFNKTVGIDGIILAKADVDEKSGAILSVSFVTGKPILFLGTGQNYEDLEEFSKEKVLEGLGLD